MMRGYIGVTDFDWYRRLLTLNPAPEEVNFWQPSGGNLVKLAPGSPFLFKLHKGKGDAICGFGLYARGTHLPIREAWNYLGASNGVSSLQELHARVVKYRVKKPGVTVTVNDAIGCHLILAPVFFERDMWIDAPSDWSSNIVQGAGRSLDDAEMSRIGQQCLERAPRAFPQRPTHREAPTLFRRNRPSLRLRAWRRLARHFAHQPATQPRKASPKAPSQRPKPALFLSKPVSLSLTNIGSTACHPVG